MTPLLPYAFLTGAPGALEWVVLFLAILILFGPSRLPEIARTIGRVLEQIRRASTEFREQIMQMDETSTIDVPPESGDVVVHADVEDVDGGGQDAGRLNQGDAADADSEEQ